MNNLGGLWAIGVVSSSLMLGPVGSYSRERLVWGMRARWASLVVQTVKNLPAMWKTWV